MRLILGSSSDGVMALGPQDKLEWLKADKKIFRQLTMDGVCIVSSKTAEVMPKSLPGRQLLITSRQGFNLDWFYANGHADAWLLGGKELALYALDKNMVSHCYFTQTKTPAPGDDRSQAIYITDLIERVAKDFGVQMHTTYSVGSDQQTSLTVWARNARN